jgi:hypothetical protein
MKINLFIIYALSVLAFSCHKSVKEETTTKNGVTVIKEYFSTGVVKTEISARGQLRHGPTRNYDMKGRLLSEVNYVDNIMEGTATNYYVKTGKINSTLEYKHGIKEGNETWYYESGKVYRLSPYINGKIEGIQKLYYESGQLMAEVPYKNGFAGKGLREFKSDGSLITEYPKLIIRREDHMKDANKILILVSLSSDAKQLKFYKGSLLEGVYLHKDLLQLASQGGSTRFDYNIPPGQQMSQKMVISVSFKTPLGNTCVISRSYNVQAANTN